jgi:poly [ADP-ribose] polymerase 2/3/4
LILPRTRPVRRTEKCKWFSPRENTCTDNIVSRATKALGKMQHEDWIDVGEKFGRDDLKGILMPGGRAKDLSSTFPRPSVKVEDIWNEVS